MTARLYCGTYAKYAGGSIKGAWLDLEDYAGPDDFMRACAELHADEEDPELMFQDYEGFPSSWYSESGTPPQAIWDWLELDDDDRAMLAAYQESFYNDAGIEQAREAFQGIYNSEADFAEQLAEDIGAMPDTSAWPANCIDWDRAANELRVGGAYVYAHHEGQLYVFRNC